MEVVRRWGRAGCVGSFEAGTGFGKTWTALLAANKLLEKYPVPRRSRWDHEVVVIVPTLVLQDKWKRDLQGQGITDAGVYVVNTAVELDLQCRFLILDEVHEYTGPHFRKIFERTDYQLLLCLTATLPEDDERKEVITDRAPLIDSVSLEECRKNGWTSEYIVYNLGIELTAEERDAYDKASSSFARGFAYFEHDLQKMYAMMRNKTLRAKWAASHDITEGQILGMAKNATLGLSKRSEIIYNAQNKKGVVIEVADRFPNSRIITFNQKVDVADQLTEMLGPRARSYHSKVKGDRSRKMSRQDILDETLKLFADGDLQVVNSAKALDQGVDIPTIDIGIILSGTSKLRQGIQRRGRVIRKDGDKEAIIVEAYALETQDESWLHKRQKGIPPSLIRWIDSIDDIPIPG